MRSAPSGMVIVGAGECGVRAAVALRERGYEGRVILISDEAHAPCERPPLSKAAPIAPEPQPKTILSYESLQAFGVDRLSATRVVAIDREARLVRLSDGVGLRRGLARAFVWW